MDERRNSALRQAQDERMFAKAVCASLPALMAELGRRPADRKRDRAPAAAQAARKSHGGGRAENKNTKPLLTGRELTASTAEPRRNTPSSRGASATRRSMSRLCVLTPNPFHRLLRLSARGDARFPTPRQMCIPHPSTKAAPIRALTNSHQNTA